VGWGKGCRWSTPAGENCDKKIRRFNGRYQRVREILDEVERPGRMQEQSQGWKRILKTILPRKNGCLDG